MSKSLTQAKEKLAYIQTLRGNAGLGFLNELILEHREKKSAIRMNRELSHEGKEKQYKNLAAVYDRKILELANEMQTSGHAAAREAKQIAEETLLAQLPKVDEHKRSLFARKVEELEAAIKFAVTPKRAKEALDELVRVADEPALANDIKGKILSLSDHVINLAPPVDRPAMRQEIGQLYDAASRQAMPEGAHEAKEIIEVADRMLATSNIPNVIEVPLREISVWTSSYIHNAGERLKKLDGGDSE